jgi:nicotinamide N-methyltransferase
MATPHLDALRRDGFVVVEGLLPPRLLLATQAAAKYTTERARRGQWPHVRTEGKQYPPWSPWQKGDKIWGVQHLLHPKMNVRDVFAETYFGDEVLEVVKELLEAGDDELVMELFNLLVSPERDFELGWHRDDVRPDLPEEEEERQLRAATPHGVQLHAQYNVALFDDASLVVVPGSHQRVRTDVERAAGPHDVLPSQSVVALKPGDAVFYDSNILHRGVYQGVDVSSNELGRMTLHGSVGRSGHGPARARAVLQHSVGEWVGGARFPSLPDAQSKRAEGMRRRLVELGSSTAGQDLGYSLVG